MVLNLHEKHTFCFYTLNNVITNFPYLKIMQSVLPLT